MFAADENIDVGFDQAFGHQRKGLIDQQSAAGVLITLVGSTPATDG